MSAGSPCQALLVTGGICEKSYIEHGPVSQSIVMASTPMDTAVMASMAPSASAWSHPTNSVFPSANAGRVVHYTAARSHVPPGPFSNLSTPQYGHGQGRSQPHGFTQGPPALLTNVSARSTSLVMRIFFTPYAVRNFMPLFR
jgi:hypothetical protein